MIYSLEIDYSLVYPCDRTSNVNTFFFSYVEASKTITYYVAWERTEASLILSHVVFKIFDKLYFFFNFFHLWELQMLKELIVSVSFTWQEALDMNWHTLKESYIFFCCEFIKQKFYYNNKNLDIFCRTSYNNQFQTYGKIINFLALHF